MSLNPNELNLAIRQSAETLEIYLYDDIKPDSYDWWSGAKLESETSCKYVQKMLEENPGISKIELHINSNGGDVKEGVGIYSLLARHKAQKTAYIDGFAASIASVIAMACDEIVMSSVSLMFIHHAWMLAAGNANELRKAADDLDKIDEQSTRAYKEHAGDKLPNETLQALLDAETWLTPEECLEYGLCERVETKQKEEDPKTVAQRMHQTYKQQMMREAAQENKTIMQKMAAQAAKKREE